MNEGRVGLLLSGDQLSWRELYHRPSKDDEDEDPCLLLSDEKLSGRSVCEGRMGLMSAPRRAIASGSSPALRSSFISDTSPSASVCTRCRLRSSWWRTRDVEGEADGEDEGADANEDEGDHALEDPQVRVAFVWAKLMLARRLGVGLG